MNETEQRPDETQAEHQIPENSSTATQDSKANEQTQTQQQTTADKLGEFEERARRAADTLRKSGEAGINRLQEKQDGIQKQIAAHDQGKPLESLLGQLEAILYRDETTGRILSFPGFYIGLLVFCSFLTNILFKLLSEETESFFSGILECIVTSWHIGQPVFLFFCLCMVIRQKHALVIGILGTGFLSELLAIINLSDGIGGQEPFSFRYSIWHLLLYITLIFVYTIVFLQKQKES